ncbi:hypothetical protein KUTeg_007537 [Tegillarca granosa]|uniref:ERAP1-like C-terminal domain-containing protein n=1 Tax=Tegillarca granosa TaxID=220873 RepID=A0ABQ9FHJ8_TEGGR|nr:hypothetical protein KUTeg_007537 [Tegillarca granosa]
MEHSLITEEACKHGVPAITPDIKETVLCTTIKESDYTVWNLVYDYFKTSPASEQRLLIRVLGCSKEPWILRRQEISFLCLKKTYKFKLFQIYLSYSIDTNIIRMQDTYFVITAVSANIYGRNIAWDFVQDNWMDLLNYGIGIRRVGQLLLYTTWRFNTEHVLDQINSLRVKYPNFERELSSYFNQALETVGNNLNWISNNYNQIEEWHCYCGKQSKSSDIVILTVEAVKCLKVTCVTVVDYETLEEFGKINKARTLTAAASTCWQDVPKKRFK